MGRVEDHETDWNMISLPCHPDSLDSLDSPDNPEYEGTRAGPSHQLVRTVQN